VQYSGLKTVRDILNIILSEGKRLIKKENGEICTEERKNLRRSSKEDTQITERKI
jgi:hypothetical protein